MAKCNQLTPLPCKGLSHAPWNSAAWPRLQQLRDEEHLFGDAECPDDDVGGVVGRLEPDFDVVIAGVLIVPVALALLLYTAVHRQLVFSPECRVGL